MILKVFGCRFPLKCYRIPLEFDDFEGLWTLFLSFLVLTEIAK